MPFRKESFFHWHSFFVDKHEANRDTEVILRIWLLPSMLPHPFVDHRFTKEFSIQKDLNKKETSQERKAEYHTEL
jgi:hypothetical protein